VADSLLDVSGLCAGYGGNDVVRGISMTVDRGQVVSVIGANGAGKSSILRALSGALAPSRGRVTFDGRDITGLRPHKVSRHGIAHCPEGSQIFTGLTVLDNLAVGHLNRGRAIPRDQLLDEIFELLPKLAERRQQVAGTLSGGERQMLAIGRALMSNPVLLLLDEPSMGLSAKISHIVFSKIRDITATGRAVLIAEQNVREGLAVSDRGYVIASGQVVMEGEPAALLADPALQSLYFGHSEVPSRNPQNRSLRVEDGDLGQPGELGARRRDGRV